MQNLIPPPMMSPRYRPRTVGDDSDFFGLNDLSDFESSDTTSGVMAETTFAPSDNMSGVLSAGGGVATRTATATGSTTPGFFDSLFSGLGNTAKAAATTAANAAVQQALAAGGKYTTTATGQKVVQLPNGSTVPVPATAGISMPILLGGAALLLLVLMKRK